MISCHFRTAVICDPNSILAGIRPEDWRPQFLARPMGVVQAFKIIPSIFTDWPTQLWLPYCWYALRLLEIIALVLAQDFALLAQVIHYNSLTAFFGFFIVLKKCSAMLERSRSSYLGVIRKINGLPYLRSPKSVAVQNHDSDIKADLNCANQMGLSQAYLGRIAELEI